VIFLNGEVLLKTNPAQHLGTKTMRDTRSMLQNTATSAK